MLPDFDPDFRDLPDFILKITYRIWEGKDPGLVRRHYAANCPVRSPDGLVIGADRVVSATEATMAAMPDRRLLGEDVVWKKVADDGTYLSSHRILSLATHTGPGAYGDGTGKRLRYRVLADCVVRANQVVEEWLIRDQGAIARTLGMTPRALAETQLAAADAGAARPADPGSDYHPTLPPTALGAMYRDLWAATWRGDDLAAASAAYDYAATIEGPGGMPHSGPDEVQAFHARLRATVDAPELTIDDQTEAELHDCGHVNGTMMAMRHTVRGKTTGAGFLEGAPAGVPVEIMVLSQVRFLRGRIIQEWVILDEVALWRQALA